MALPLAHRFPGAPNDRRPIHSYVSGLRRRKFAKIAYPGFSYWPTSAATNAISEKERFPSVSGHSLRNPCDFGIAYRKDVFFGQSIVGRCFGQFRPSRHPGST